MDELEIYKAALQKQSQELAGVMGNLALAYAQIDAMNAELEALKKDKQEER